MTKFCYTFCSYFFIHSVYSFINEFIRWMKNKSGLIDVVKAKNTSTFR